MKALVLERLGGGESGAAPLRWLDMPEPVAASGEVLIHVRACGVCHTELDEIEGRTPPPQLPVVLGQQAIGRVMQCNLGLAHEESLLASAWASVRP